MILKSIKKSLTKKPNKTKKSLKRPVKSVKSSRAKRSIKSKKSYKMKRTMKMDIDPVSNPFSFHEDVKDDELPEIRQRQQRREMKLKELQERERQPPLTWAQKHNADQFIKYDSESEEDSDSERDNNDEAMKLWVAVTDPAEVGEKKHYKVINEALINGRQDQLKGSFKALYLQIVRMFNKEEPLMKNMKVYRGMRVTKEFLKNELVTVPYKSLMSTSENFDIAHRFMGDECCMLEITLLPGIKVIDIDYYEPWKGKTEEEILVQPGGRFTYLGKGFIKDRDDRVRVYKLSYGPW